IEVAADESDQPEKHDRPTAVERQEDTHQQGKDESGPRDYERIALADPALQDRHRHTGRGDRIDAMSYVIDLVGDVGPDMQAERPQQRREEERPVHAALAE